MSDSLQNLRILVTRPEEQAEKLCDLIEAAGGIPVRLPVINIRPVADTAALQRQLAQITNHDLAIFVSQNAVRYTLQFLDKEIHALGHLRVFAIGQATGVALQRAGVSATTVAGEKSSTETLLEHPLLQAERVKGKRIVIFRGSGGRELLAEQLLERGARVDYLELYQRTPASYRTDELEDIWSQACPHCVVVTSTEGLQNLFDMLSSKQQALLLNTPLVVLSERIAELAINLGYRKTPVIARETSDAGLIDAIMITAGATNDGRKSGYQI